MIGRAAQGRPWIFREIAHFLQTGTELAPPLVVEVQRLLLDHLQDHYTLYGEETGVRSARKHIGWYVRTLPGGEAFRKQMNTLQSSALQWRAVQDYFEKLAGQMDRIPGPLSKTLELDEEKNMETSA
jgi:tRNA-dihydrouridine synthase B